ncbi:26S proteasome regulatory subunit, partial [Hortaea werneckii]
MANDEPKAQDKGKGKAEEKQVNGASKDGQKDGKKKEGELEINPEEELSEEDQKLKEELDMLVERLTENDKSLYKPALEAIKTNIKTSTSSMTAVPKPLKFLRPHYEKLCETYEKWPDSEEKRSLADTLSVLGMTYSDDEERRDTLKYRLLAPSEGIGSWGHEYMRHLALEIGSEYQHRLDEEQDTEDLAQLTRTLVPFYLAHNAEADAVDILSELEMI